MCSLRTLTSPCLFTVKLVNFSNLYFLVDCWITPFHLIDLLWKFRMAVHRLMFDVFGWLCSSDMYFFRVAWSELTILRKIHFYLLKKQCNKLWFYLDFKHAGVWSQILEQDWKNAEMNRFVSIVFIPRFHTITIQ